MIRKRYIEWFVVIVLSIWINIAFLLPIYSLIKGIF